MIDCEGKDAMEAYHYTESGLDNVMVFGVIPCLDVDGDEVVTIPNITGLHHAIAKVIVAHAAGISGKELRFLRTEMGMTQAELAKVVHHDAQSIARWEKGECNIAPTAEALIRLLAIQHLKLEVEPEPIEELSERCIAGAAPQPILINGNDPSHYSPMGMAA
jgi:transcriptional regulator with XRE-family HTH domain